MGIQEYCPYDAETPPNLKRIGKRLLGWQLDKATGPQEMQADEQGRLCSSYLNSFLVPDKSYLCLYDRYGQLRLTGMKATMRHAEMEVLRAEAEARQAQMPAEKLCMLGIDPDQL